MSQQDSSEHRAMLSNSVTDFARGGMGDGLVEYGFEIAQHFDHDGNRSVVHGNVHGDPVGVRDSA